MKFYITIEPYWKLNNVFSNLNMFYLIDVDTLIRDSSLNPDKQSHRYLINTEIERLIVAAARSRRYTGVLYINSMISCDIILGIRNSISGISSSRIEDMALLDDYDTPKLKQYYGLFDEVIFFPTFKKMRIVECKPYNLKK